MQLSYSRDPASGLPGMIADTRPHPTTTRQAEGVVTVGLYVIAGATEDSAKHPTADFTATPGVALGIVHRDAHHAQPQGATTHTYQDKESLGVVRRGAVWVAPEAEHPNALPGRDAPVYVRITPATGKPVGSLRAAAGEIQDRLTITVSATSDAFEFELTANGDDLAFTSGSSQNAAAKAAAWAAYINGLDDWTASADSAVITATHTSRRITTSDAGTGFTSAVAAHTGSAIAVAVPGAYFRQNGEGGVSLVELT